MLVPSEEVIELKSGQKRKVERLFYPGYVLIEMAMEPDCWHLVRQVPNVRGFIGGDLEPTPLAENEAQNILSRLEVTRSSKPKMETIFEVGEVVRVTEGPFADFSGSIEDVNYAKSRLWVAISIFGRTHLHRVGLQSGGAGIKMAQDKKRSKKKLMTLVKLQAPAGQASPAPPVGPILGQNGLNIMEVCNAFNAQTKDVEPGLPVPMVISVYADRSFSLQVKSPPAAVLLRKAAGVDKGSGVPQSAEGRQGGHQIAAGGNRSHQAGRSERCRHRSCAAHAGRHGSQHGYRGGTLMARLGKRMRSALEQVDRERLYSVEEAVQLLGGMPQSALLGLG